MSRSCGKYVVSKKVEREECDRHTSVAFSQKIGERDLI